MIDNDVDICIYLLINIYYICMIICICFGYFVYVMLKRNVCVIRLFLDKNERKYVKKFSLRLYEYWNKKILCNIYLDLYIY